MKLSQTFATATLVVATLATLSVNAGIIVVPTGTDKAVQKRAKELRKSPGRIIAWGILSFFPDGKEFKVEVKEEGISLRGIGHHVTWHLEERSSPTECTVLTVHTPLDKTYNRFDYHKVKWFVEEMASTIAFCKSGSTEARIAAILNKIKATDYFGQHFLTLWQEGKKGDYPDPNTEKVGT